MAKLSSLKQSKAKIDEGVWVEFEAGIRIRVTSINNKRYTECVEKLLKPHLRRIRSGIMTIQERSQLIKPAVAKYLLLDWDGIEDDDGQVIKYSSAKAQEIFDNEEYVDFFNFVIESANEQQLFRDQSYAEAEVNL